MDFYKVLGVDRTATLEDIKKARKTLARKYHPDLNPGNPEAEEKFKEVEEAYDTLSDPEKRSQYDRFGFYTDHGHSGGGGGRVRYDTTEWTTTNPFGDHGNAGGGFGFEEFLRSMMDGGARPDRPGTGRTSSAAPSEDMDFGVTVSMEEAGRGVDKRVTVSMEDTCSECDGMGTPRNSRGQVDLSRGTCSKCRGKGRSLAQRSVSVTIPAGAWDGYKVVLPGQGPKNARGKRGNLYATIQISKHPRFERDGQNLTFEVQIPYTVAALGGEVQVETLQGKRMPLIVPSGIQSGQRLRVAGQGMPSLETKIAGDMFARVKVVVPKDLTDKERVMLEELARLRNDPVRFSKR